jgi:hypothetical protein
MKTVYRLSENVRHIQAVQAATLNSPDYGLKQTHGLFGSDEWWTNIECGALSVIKISGVISKVCMGSQGDWPMFEIVDDSGIQTSWTREVNSRELDEYYRVGFKVEFDYVVQLFKKDHGTGPETKIVTEIRIGNRLRA